MIENEIKDYAVTEIGTIQISPQVIEVITKLSTIEVEGVAGLSGGFTEGIVEFLGRNKNTTKGIKVEVGQKETAVDVSVIIKYGYPIPKVAEEIQQSVKNAIESMTELTVVEVNVHIDAIQIEEKDE
ncbi:MAG: Asp23/Gls24 family envelope stress response protein [Tepidibacillus sp.]|uniref:Asp23/Gls24 family envelope stress response protein n=1 Tax=Tepidibacillus sp. HK-1 TaxID=1883407 RepID=UPI0008532BE3|nr:Asp23/Gls24 family envelope stress response protein [Tepidibacillus sp. HK-1]GBF11035.1 alkaline shock protein 23 [Tepidibacillus sp. HK-1]